MASSVEQNPFMWRLSRYANITPPDIHAFSKILEPEVVVGRRRELIAEGPTPGDGVLWTRAERGTAYTLA